MKAELLEKQWEIPDDASEELIADYARQAAAEFTYGDEYEGKRRVQAASCGSSDPQGDELDFSGGKIDGDTVYIKQEAGFG